MGLRNENIGVAVGIVILAAGLALTGGDPGQIEGALIAVIVFCSAVGVGIYLNERERSRRSSDMR